MTEQIDYVINLFLECPIDHEKSVIYGYSDLKWLID